MVVGGENELQVECKNVFAFRECLNANSKGTESHASDACHILHRPIHPVQSPKSWAKTELNGAQYALASSKPRKATGNRYLESAVIERNATARYCCHQTKPQSSTPPEGRPLAGPPQLVNLLKGPDFEASMRKSGQRQSPTTTIYVSHQVPAAMVEPGVYREMSADEQLFVEAASALSHAGTKSDPPAAKKPRLNLGMPPPPFALQQRPS